MAELEEIKIKYVCGIDFGSQSCSGCVIQTNKNVAIKPTTFVNDRGGWQVWEKKLSQLDASPSQILIGIEATSRYWEKLYHELEQRGYVPGERVATYQELARLHILLSDEAEAYQNEIQALLVILFPEFTQVFAEPCLPGALRALHAYPSASEIAAAGVEAIAQVLENPSQGPTRHNRSVAQKLVGLAPH